MTGLTGTMGGACYFKESDQERLVHLKLIKKTREKKNKVLRSRVVNHLKIRSLVKTDGGEVQAK